MEIRATRKGRRSLGMNGKRRKRMRRTGARVEFLCLWDGDAERYANIEIGPFRMLTIWYADDVG